MRDDAGRSAVATYRALTARAVAALGALADTGEAIEDEWQYVTDLRTVYQGRLTAVGEALGDAVAPPAVVAAVDRAIEEAELVADPHRAIDWLSTLPQVVLLALGADA